MVQYLKDREDSVQFTAYSILSSLLQSPTSRTETMDMMENGMNMASSLTIQSIYPVALKLIFTKYKHLIGLIFTSIETATSSKVRSYAIQCITLILSSYFEFKEVERYRIQNGDGDIEEKKEEEFDDDDDDETKEEDLDKLMDEYVIKYKTKMGRDGGYILDHQFLWQCLSDNTGDPDYYRSVCQLMQVLIACDIHKIKKSVYLQKNGDRLKYLLQMNASKIRYDQHMADLNIPNYMKSSVVIDNEWNKFEGELKSVRAASEILDVFNAIFDNKTIQNDDDEDEDKQEQNIIFDMIVPRKHIKNLNVADCIESCINLSEYIVKHREWTYLISVYNLFTNLCEHNSVKFRETLLKQDRNNDERAQKLKLEGWCSNNVLKHISKCLESCDEMTAKSICDFLYEITTSYHIDPDEFTASYYRNYNVKSQNPAISSPYLLDIVNYLFGRLVEKTSILDYDNSKTPYLLIEYYQTLGALTTVSTMSKIICCYHCKMGDCISWIVNRLKQIIGLFILGAHSLDQKKHKKDKYHRKYSSSNMYQKQSRKSPLNFSNMRGSLENSPNQKHKYSKNKEYHQSESETESKQIETEIEIEDDIRYNKSYLIGQELLRILNLIQNILYLAPTEIKRAFVTNNLSELIMKLYETTMLYQGKIFNELHDVLLSVCVNFISHCNDAKYVLCYKDNKKIDFLLLIKKEAFKSNTRMNSYTLCFEILDCMMFSSDGINLLISNYNKHKNGKNLLEKCVDVVNDRDDKNYPKRKRLCMKLLRNLAMQSSIGCSILIKYFLPKRWFKMIEWLEKKDEDFINICCEFLRNLSFISQFKNVFVSNDKLLIKIYQMLSGHNDLKMEQRNLRNDDERRRFKSKLEIKMSLIMIYWNIIYKKSENVRRLKELLNLRTFDPLIKTLNGLKEFGIEWNEDLNDIKILLNSLLDRLKHVNKLMK